MSANSSVLYFGLSETTVYIIAPNNFQSFYVFGFYSLGNLQLSSMFSIHIKVQ